MLRPNFLAVASVVLSCVCGQAVAGVVSPYYISSHAGDVYVVQGNAVTHSFPTINSSAGPVVVIDNNTIATTDTHGVGGGTYALDGTPTGVTFSNPDPGPQVMEDAATDGTTIYGLAWFVQDIFSHDLDFSNRQSVKHWSLTLGYRYSGIAYDPSDNTLWLSGWSISEMHHVDLNGDLIGSFPLTADKNVALALDPADDTLWFNGYGTNTLYQYDKNGNLLDQITPAGLPEITYSGADINVVPEPTTAVFLLGTGLWSIRRRIYT